MTQNDEQSPLHSPMGTPNANGAATVRAGNSNQTQPSTRTSPAQTKPRYGAWMLVTRKNHQAAGIANNRHNNLMLTPRRDRYREPMTSARPSQLASSSAQTVNPPGMGSRGRGGRSGFNRGRGRGEGRGLSGNVTNHALDSSAIHWNVQSGSTLFQFGNNQPSGDRLTRTNPNQFVLGSTSGFTPGEGGDQTSPDPGLLS
nr:LINE-type retrotransposon LIb DNA [Ipomoea batatas]